MKVVTGSWGQSLKITRAVRNLKAQIDLGAMRTVSHDQIDKLIPREEVTCDLFENFIKRHYLRFSN